MNKDLKKVKEHVLWTCGGRAFQAEATGSAKALWWDGLCRKKSITRAERRRANRRR